MYKIEYENVNWLNEVKLTNTRNTTYAKIDLNLGASLQELCINNTLIIESLAPLKYSETYASSILFPFANRIKDGTYNFNGERYQFEINHKEENNALHGLVFNKTFTVIDKKVSQTEASIKLEYNEINKSQGFPYTYSIQLTYTLNDNGLNLNVLIKNTDSKKFPFTLGWHPYFISDNLYESTLQFDCNNKLVFDDRMITINVEDYKNNNTFEIKDKNLDDCFVLNSKAIKFSTPSYDMELTTSSKDTFLQLYTPPKTNTIAIEPTTGVSDSFNNKIGLQVLKPGKTYCIDWEVKFKARE